MPTTVQLVQAKATIDTPETIPDSQVSSWSISDTFGAISREFTIECRKEVNVQVGNEVIIRAGYDQNRILMLDGIIDEAQKSRNANDLFTSATGRDAGAREIQTLKITKTWQSVPPKSISGLNPPPPTILGAVSNWSAHDVIRDAASLMGLQVGALEFPNYFLYTSYVAIGQTLLSILQELVQPFNQFSRIQYVTQVHSKVLSVVKIDWNNPAVGGYQVKRSQTSGMVRRQTLYLEQPRLNEIEKIIIRGAAWTTPKVDLGTTIRIEYNRNTVMAEVGTALGGQVPLAGDDVVTNANNAAYFQQVTTETTVVETLFGDKVLNRDEQVVINNDLSTHTRERYWYYEPGTAFVNVDPPSPLHGDVATFLTQSLSPSENALLFMVHSRREGYIDYSFKSDDGLGNITTITGTVFREKERHITQYNYDANGNITCENNSTQEYDTALGAWGLTSHTTRTHSQTTGGSVRTTLLNFVFEDSKFKILVTDVQQVGGGRPRINSPASRQNVLTHQSQSPQGEVDKAGNVIDPGAGFFTWTFENPYMGQYVCDIVYQLALDEQVFQLTEPKWDEIEFESVLNPNIFIGQTVQIEEESGVFKSFIVEQVTHRFNTSSAHTTGNAKRLTREDIPQVM